MFDVQSTICLMEFGIKRKMCFILSSKKKANEELGI